MPRSNKKAKTGRPPPPSSSSAAPMRNAPSSLPSIPSSSSTPSINRSRKERKATQASMPKSAIPALPPVYRVQDSDDAMSDVEEGQIRSSGGNLPARTAKRRTQIPSPVLSSPLPKKPAYSMTEASPSFPPSNGFSGNPIASSSIPPRHTMGPHHYHGNQNTHSPGQMPPRAPPTAPRMQSSSDSSVSLPRWTSGEKAEAMTLIKEITALGLDPAQLVQAGIRQEIVTFCCNELRLPFSTQGEKPAENGRQFQAVNEARAGPSSNISPRDRQIEEESQCKLSRRPKSTSAVNAVVKSQSEMAAPLPSRPSSEASKLPDRHSVAPASTLAAQEKLVTAEEAPKDMEAMRRAALASMKRKKAIAEGKEQRPTSDRVSAGEMEKADTSLEASPIDVPKGPKAMRPFYHDIDAPPAQPMGEDDEPEAESQPGHSSSIADPRQVKCPKLLSYADTYSKDVDAPAGEVDLEAPLPSLLLQPHSIAGGSDAGRSTSSRKRRPVAADLIELSSAVHPPPSRPRPFLPSANWQQMVVDYSDDDEEEEDEKGQVRQASTAFIAQTWKQMNTSEEEQAESPRIGNLIPAVVDSVVKPLLPRSTSDAVLKKEQEIREMTAKIQELEKRRGQTPTDVKVIAKVARKAVESSEATTISGVEIKEDGRYESAIPAYESPFSRYPGLRQTLGNR